MKKLATFSMDVEDFSDAYCLRKKDHKDYPSMMDGMSRFLDLLDEHHIKGTFFVLACRLEEDKPLLLEAAKRGHHIGMHGYFHVLPVKETLEEFCDHLSKGKKLIEKELGVEVIGFRAPGFALRSDELAALPSLGFKYDASEMDYKVSTYGASMDTSGFNKVSEGVYVKDGFYEMKMSKSISHPLYGMPISGGGYLRMPPKHFVDRVLKKAIHNGSFYSFYAHPFELSEVKTPKVGYLGPLNTIYLNRRKHFYRLLVELIELLKSEGYSFTSYEQIVKDLSI